MTDLAVRRACIAVFLFACSSFATANVLESYGKLALPFEPNLGQTDPRVKFLARGPGLQVFLTPTDAVYRLDAAEGSSAIRLTLAGARRDARIGGLERLPGESHYLTGLAGGRPVTHVPHYGRVMVERVYRGIDLAYYGNLSQLEYDFIVAPDADPRAIAIDVQGADRLEIDTGGRLIIHTDAGSLVWKAPIAYQERAGERRTVASSYVMRGKNRIGFRVAEYDRRLPLVIDPILAYSTLLGGTGHDRAYAIAVDSDQSAVITGVAGAVDFPTTLGAYDRTSGGIFVTKLNAAGTALVYSTFLGPGRGTGVALQGGHAYVAGYTFSGSFATAGALNNTFPGATNAFVAKLTIDGSGLEYGAVVAQGLEGPRIAVDASGNAYLAGTTNSNAFPTTASAYQATRPTAAEVYQGDLDVYFAKLNATGSALLYSTFLASTENDQARDIAVDANGMAYVTGSTLGRSFAVPGFPAATLPFPTTASAYQQVFTGVARSFVTKFDPTASGPASIVYSTLLGEGDHDFTAGIAVDPAGNAYVTGAGQGGAFVTKLNAAGSALAYTAVIAGAEGHRIALDGFNNAIVVGFVPSAQDFVPVDGIAGINGGDLFLARLDATGASVDYSTYIEGHFDAALDVAVDPFNAVYVAGTALPAGLPTEAFVSKIVTIPPPVAVLSVGFYGTGAGQVTSLVGGLPDGKINCTSSCAASYYSATDVVLAATPAPGSEFVAWVAGCGGTGSCSVTTDRNIVVGAQFDTIPSSLTVVNTGNGKVTSTSHSAIDCGTACSVVVAFDTDVALTATPDEGYEVAGWSDCAGAGGSCTVNVRGAKTVTVTFREITLTGISISPPSATIAVGGQQRFTLVGTFSNGTTRALNAEHSIEASDGETCYITESGIVKCWAGPQLATKPAYYGATVLAAGTSHICAIAPDPVSGTMRVQCGTEVIPGTQGAITIAAASASTCALMPGGVVQCWAGDYEPFGAAAPATFAGVNQPAIVPIDLGAEGGPGLCALLSTGEPSCIGPGTPMVAGVSNAVAVSIGVGHACALLADGRVKCWGDNERGQLGRGTIDTINGSSGWANPPDFVLESNGVANVAITNAIGIVSGDYYSCALMADTTVKCWGDQYRNAPPASPVAHTIMTPAGSTTTPLTGVVAVGAGAYHACGVMLDGTANCWGSNNQGLLGLPPGPFLCCTDDALPSIMVSNAVAVSWGVQSPGARIMASGRAIATTAGAKTVTARIGPFTASAILNVVVNTPTGSNVTVTPVAANGASPVTVTFDSVSQSGETTVVLNTGIPPGVSTTAFELGNPSVYYDISTTALYTAPVTICISYAGVSFSGAPKLYHFESPQPPAMVPVDVTTTVDTVSQTVCGVVNSLSPFALMVPKAPVTCDVEASASPSVLWPPNHKMRSVAVSVSLSDRCDPTVHCRIESVTSNELENGQGDGDTAPDWEITGALTLKLRAERSGSGSGRVYSIGLRCVDASGNSTARTIPVTVPHNR